MESEKIIFVIELLIRIRLDDDENAKFCSFLKQGDNNGILLPRN